MRAEQRLLATYALMVTLLLGSLSSTTAAAQALAEGVIQPTGELIQRRAAMSDAFWQQQFQSRNWPYQKLNVMIFSGNATTSDGTALTTKMGPAYDPNRKTVMADPKFFTVAQDFLMMPTDAFVTVVAAHEAGHHVQLLKGLIDQQLGPKELQADCLAGVFFADLVAKRLATQSQANDAEMRLLLMGEYIRSQHPGQNVPGGDARQAAFKKGLTEKNLSACGL